MGQGAVLEEKLAHPDRALSHNFTKFADMSC